MRTAMRSDRNMSRSRLDRLFVRASSLIVRLFTGPQSQAAVDPQAGAWPTRALGAQGRLHTAIGPCFHPVTWADFRPTGLKCKPAAKEKIGGDASGRSGR